MDHKYFDSQLIYFIDDKYFYTQHICFIHNNYMLLTINILIWNIFIGYRTHKLKDTIFQRITRHTRSALDEICISKYLIGLNTRL